MDISNEAIAEVAGLSREREQDKFIDSNKNCFRFIADLWRGVCDYYDIDNIHSDGKTLILVFKDGRKEYF